MGEVREALRLANLTLRISGKIIAMGMGYYRRGGRPCNGFHELFFNGLMYVLQGVVSNTLSNLEQNAEFFGGYQFQMQVTGDRYTPLTSLSLSMPLEIRCVFCGLVKRISQLRTVETIPQKRMMGRTKMIQEWTSNSLQFSLQ